MSQGDVLKVLKRKNDWLTNKQIAQKLGLSDSTVNANLNKLVKSGDILRKTSKIIPEYGFVKHHYKIK